MLLVQMSPHPAYRAPGVQLRAAQDAVVVPDHTWVVRDDAGDHWCLTIGRLVKLVSTVIAELGHDNGPIRDTESFVSC